MATKEILMKSGITFSEEEAKCNICRENEKTTRMNVTSDSIYLCYYILYTITNFHQHFEMLSSGENMKVAATIWNSAIWSIQKVTNELVFKGENFDTKKLVEEMKVRCHGPECGDRIDRSMRRAFLLACHKRGKETTLAL